MSGPRRLSRHGVGLAVLAVVLAGLLVLPAWFVLIEETRPVVGHPPSGPVTPPAAEPAPTVAPAADPAAGPHPVPLLAPAPDRDTPALVSGRVRDPQGQALSALPVRARPVDAAGPDWGQTAGQSAVSDALGGFQLTLRPGAWLIGCEGSLQEVRCLLLPGEEREVELLADTPPPRVALRVEDPHGELLELPALLARLSAAERRSEAHGQRPAEGGALLRALPGARQLEVWPGDPRWLPWRGPVPDPLRVTLRAAPGQALRLRLAADQTRADLVCYDATRGTVVTQRMGLGLPAPAEEDPQRTLWSGAGLCEPTPDGGREVRLVLGLSEETGPALRLVITALRPLYQGQSATSAQRTVEVTLERDPRGAPPPIDLR